MTVHAAATAERSPSSELPEGKFVRKKRGREEPEAPSILWRIEKAITPPQVKALACIPIIGIIPSLMHSTVYFLSEYSGANTSRKITLIEEGSMFRKANMIRSLASIALVIAAIALGIISTSQGIVGMAVLLGIAGVCHLDANRLKRLQRNLRRLEADLN